MFIPEIPDNQLFEKIKEIIEIAIDLEEETYFQFSDASTNDEINELLNFKPYIESNNALSILVQAEVLNLVRGKINSNPEVINNVIGSIKEFKNIKKKEEDNFKDYIRNYSELSYKEYLELKNGTK